MKVSDTLHQSSTQVKNVDGLRPEKENSSFALKSQEKAKNPKSSKSGTQIKLPKENSFLSTQTEEKEAIKNIKKNNTEKIA